MELFDVTERALEVALHGTEVRQTVLANNMANVNTPGFRRSDVQFGGELARALASGSPSAVGGVAPQVIGDSSGAMRSDGNNVDVDRESTYMAENQLQFQTLMAVVTKNLTTMSSLISGAR